MCTFWNVLWGPLLHIPYLLCGLPVDWESWLGGFLPSGFPLSLGFLLGGALAKAKSSSVTTQMRNSTTRTPPSALGKYLVGDKNKSLIKTVTRMSVASHHPRGPCFRSNSQPLFSCHCRQKCEHTVDETRPN